MSDIAPIKSVVFNNLELYESLPINAPRGLYTMKSFIT